MTQDEVNRAEWENAENWSDSIVGIYFSKRDSRIWVPKRRPNFGRTLNLARPEAAWLLVGLMAGLPLIGSLLSRRRSVRSA